MISSEFKKNDIWKSHMTGPFVVLGHGRPIWFPIRVGRGHALP
jgi:hypothetical protein